MENFNLKKFLVENKLTTNSKMLNEILKESLEYSDQERVNMRNNSILFKTSEAPEKITLQITNTGKEKIKSELENWIPQDKRVPTFQPDIKDKVTLDRSLDFGHNITRIGEIGLNMGGREAPSFGKYTRDNGTVTGTTRFSVFAEYLPVAEKGVLTATIGLTKGLERETGKSTAKNLEKVNTCEFKKIEVGEVDDRGWFEIVSVN